MYNTAFDNFAFWLSHSPWPCPSIALLIFLESSPLIGLFIPGVILLPAIGSISGQGLLDFQQLLACAFIGAMLIDSLGYWIGRTGHSQLQGLFKHGQSEDVQQRTQYLFKRYGLLALFGGRIMFLIHPMAPMTAGMLGVKAIKFYLVDSLAALIWLLLYLGGGHWGTILFRQISATQQHWVLSAGALGLLIWLIHWFFNRPE